MTMKSVSMITLLAAGCWIATATSAQVAQQAAPPQFTTFPTFLQQTQNARASEHLSRPGNKVRDAAAFEEMRQHILRMHRDMPVSGSYVLNEHTYDCVPVMQQPSVRHLGIRQIAGAPPTPAAPAGANAGAANVAPPQIPPGLNFDAHGNLMGCTSGHVPIRRITLEETARFETLEHFFQKGPDGAGQAKQHSGAEPPCAAAGDGKCHAHAYAYQNVQNFGTSSTLELWNPPVVSPQVFSLSQHWLVNNTGVTGVQTIEGGWQVFPQKYGTANAALFIYWTADGYKTTGCYNHDCPGFVQTDNSVHLGGTFTAYSSIVNGSKNAQVINMTWLLWQGNWWLKYNSTWVGYYPGGVFAQYQNIPIFNTVIPIYVGSPMLSGSNQLQFGGETVGGFAFFGGWIILPTWPGMGDGIYGTQANASLAAQQRSIYYFTSSNGNSAWTSLTATQDTPTSCYTSSVSGATLTFGGPGSYQFC